MAEVTQQGILGTVAGVYCLPLMSKKKGPKGAHTTKYFIDIKKHDVLLTAFQDKLLP